MEIFISYFYNVRFLTKEAIPLSTAVYDPKWFHDFKGESYTFIDKNGVMNGLKCFKMILGENIVNKLIQSNNMCSKDCDRSKDGSCPYMIEYEKWLHYSYPNGPIDFINQAKPLINIWKNNDCKDPYIVLLVHEKPDSLCSERNILKKWFKTYGYELKEWRKE